MDKLTSFHSLEMTVLLIRGGKMENGGDVAWVEDLAVALGLWLLENNNEVFVTGL